MEKVEQEKNRFKEDCEAAYMQTTKKMIDRCQKQLETDKANFRTSIMRLHQKELERLKSELRKVQKELEIKFEIS